MVVQTAEWHETTYRPTKRHRTYQVVCCALLGVLYFAVLLDYTFKTETICVLIALLVAMQFRGDRTRSGQESVNRIVDGCGSFSIPVRVSFKQKGLTTGNDSGALWVDGSVLHFRGLETEFALPYIGQTVSQTDDELRRQRIETPLPIGSFTVEFGAFESGASAERANNSLELLLIQWTQAQIADDPVARLPVHVKPQLATKLSRKIITNLTSSIVVFSLIASYDSMKHPWMYTIKYVGLVAMYTFVRTLGDYMLDDEYRKLRSRFPDDPSFRSKLQRFLMPPEAKGAKNANP